MSRATVITDASFCNQTRAAGWAAWIKGDGGLAIKRSGRFRERPANSTVAEVLAAANGIWLAAVSGATHILVQSDCMAVIHLIDGKARQGSPLVALWGEVMANPAMAGVNLTAKHVKGHGPIKDARTWVNDWCDTQARAHMEKQRGQHRRKNRKETGQARGSGAQPSGGRAGASWSICPRP